MTKCKQIDVCDVEIFVYAETLWQKQNGKLWARQIWKQIAEGGLVYQLELNNLIIAVATLEPMYISPDTAVVETCPSAPLVCAIRVPQALCSACSSNYAREHFVQFVLLPDPKS